MEGVWPLKTESHVPLSQGTYYTHSFFIFFLKTSRKLQKLSNRRRENDEEGGLVRCNLNPNSGQNIFFHRHLTPDHVFWMLEEEGRWRRWIIAANVYWNNCGNRISWVLNNSVVRTSLSISSMKECAMLTNGICSEALLIFAKALKLPPLKYHSYLSTAIKARFHCLKAVKSKSL